MESTARLALDPTVASVAVDAFLLARFGTLERGPSGGRAWEKAVSQLLWRPGFTRRQHAGVLGLFGRGSMSGARHELDGAGQGHEIGVWIESKSRASLDKSDIAVFHVKCLDLYRAAASDHPQATAAARWWSLLVSKGPTREPIRRICFDLGIVLCDPKRLPLPALLHTAAQPNADDYLSDVKLGEFVRLAERACEPMQRRWRVDPLRRTITMQLDHMTVSETDDLLFLQDDLTEDLLDAFDVHGEGHLEQRAARLVERLEAARLAP